MLAMCIYNCIPGFSQMLLTQIINQNNNKNKYNIYI